MHELKVQKHYYDLINSGAKTVEIRLSSARMNAMNTGDLICFNESIIKRISEVHQYDTDVFLAPHFFFSRYLITVPQIKTGWVSG